MQQGSSFPRRRTIRLSDYDYRRAASYFITICSAGREPIFGRILDAEMVPNESGRLVETEWLRSAEMRVNLELDAFVVMPNHVHGIVTILEQDHAVVDTLASQEQIDSNSRAHGSAPLRRRAQSLGSLIAGFKAATTVRINELRQTPRVPVWQRNYYEHVVRTEVDLTRIREYVQANPQRWELDRENPDRRGDDEFDRWLASQSPRIQPARIDGRPLRR